MPERLSSLTKPTLLIDPSNGQTGKYIRTDYANPNIPYDVRYARNRDREPGNFVTYALDILSRGQYASATFADTILSQGFGALDSAIVNAASQVYNPTARLSYEDLLKRYAPDYAAANPAETFILGLAGDIFLDPTTYVGAGLLGKGKKVGGVVLNEVGEKVFQNVVEFEAKRVATEFGEETAQDLVRKASATFFRSNQALEVSRSSDAIIANIIKDAPYAEKKLTELGLEDLIGKSLTQEKGLRLYLGLGKSEKEIKVYKALNPILDASGFTKVTEKLADVKNLIGEKAFGEKGYQAIKTAYSDFKYNIRGSFIVDEETKSTFNYLENFASNIQDNIVRDTLTLPSIVGKNVDFEKVSKALFESSKVIDNTRNVRGYFDLLEENGIRNEVFKGLNLNADEKVVASVFQQRLNDIAFVDYSADILRETILNGDKGVKNLIKDADDVIRYKDALLKGDAINFVATNKEFQNKLFSLETVGEMLGKKEIEVGKNTFKYGKAAKEVTVDNIKSIKGLSKDVNANIIDSIRSDKNIIKGFGSSADIAKIEDDLVSKGFEKIELNNAVIKNPGMITDETGKIYKQSVFTNKDGSIIRLVRKESPIPIKPQTIVNGKRMPGLLQNAEQFTIIKSVSAPNEAFAQKFIGNKSYTLGLDQVLNNKNVIDDIAIDPFGSVVDNIYDGNKFRNLYETAQATGQNPNTSALLLYMQRAMIAQKELGFDNFKAGLKALYGKETIADLPKAVQSRLKYVGEGLYSQGMNENLKYALKLYDQLTGWFKKGATIANPAFGIKQIFQNPLQYSFQQGLQAFKVFDPRALLEGAAIAIADGTGKGKALPDYLANLFYKSSENKPFAAQAIEILRNQRNESYLANMVITNARGEKISGLELLDASYTLGVNRGVVDDLNVVQRDIMKQISTNIPNAEPGVMNFVKESLKYWTYPENIEKFFRMSYFINGFRTGMSLEESAKIVDKTLFNYNNGLTAVEKRFVKRLIPFYSFQRNAIPLILQTALTEPGKLATISKLAPIGNGRFFEVWNKLQSGEQLTDKERYIAPGFIFQQPSVFAGRDEKGNLTFNTFNNYTPFDAIGLIGFDDKVPSNKGFFERLSFEKTAKNIILSQLNPYIKISTEIPANRYFFNDRVISESAKFGQGLGRFLDATLPQDVKTLIEFERAIDPTDGKEKFYINPYLAYGSQQLPGVTALNSYLRLTDDEMSYKERAFDFLFGVRTQKYSEASLEKTKALTTKYEIQQLRSKARLAIKQGRPNEAERRIEQLKQFVEYTSQEASYQSPK